jgi:hypothetical protein
MSLDKAIKYGKEKRRPYHKRGKYDRSCRPGGSCPWCQGSRMHKHRRRIPLPEYDEP